MNILVSGSLAHDYVMRFPDSFKHHILPEHIHILNVSFIVDRLQKNFGGCAGNIAYTMKLLGATPLMLGAVGSDAKDYIAHWEKCSIRHGYVQKTKRTLTATAHITTDKDDNQINAFYPGALDVYDGSVEDVKDGVTLALISPTKKETMDAHAKECAEKNIPFCFDPGQQITALTSQELMRIIGQAAFVIGNDYEMTMLEKKTGWNTRELLNHVDVVIVTLGEKGSTIITKDGQTDIAPCKPTSVEDPTGAGDAYRAGFFVAHAAGDTLKTCGQVGSVAAAYAIEHYGTQHHTFTREEFESRYKETYGEPLTLPS
jgi:adenosine kinase